MLGCELSGLEVHVLASGSDGNCTALSSEGVTILIDAGISGRRIARLMNKVGLDPKGLSAILLTHEHSDHVSGAGIMSRKYKVPVCCNENTLICSNIGPVDSTILFQTQQTFSIEHLRITPLPISHNAAEPNAFFIAARDKKFLLATDLGRVNPEVFGALREADLAVIEANHDVQMLINGPYPPKLKGEIRSDRGHLSNIDCARALWATYSEERKVFLAHISKNNNTPELAQKTVARTLGCCNDKVDCLMHPDDFRTIGL